MIYKHVFFDLDRTLWDFEANSYETLLEIYKIYKLKDKGISDYKEFISIYKYHNSELWKLYRINKISQQELRRERFQRTLLHFSIDDFFLSEEIGESYVEKCPRKTKLFPFTIEVLETNGPKVEKVLLSKRNHIVN